MSFLIDTNVISELRKAGRCDAAVRRFFESVSPDQLYLPAQVVGELRRGGEMLRLRGDVAQAERIESWLDTIQSDFSNRVLPFDTDCAQVWGRLMAPNPHNPIDKQIAAIALTYDLTLLTRNMTDFADCGVKLFNPFK